MSLCKPASPLHGLAPIAPAHARLLVLGSFPGLVSLREQRYYAHPRNQFWPIVCDLLSIDAARLDYDGRVRAVSEKGLAIWDVYATCEREGSLDSAIREAQPNDLAGLMTRLPQLRGVAHNGGESARARGTVQALGLATFRLPSTSPANASWSLQRKTEAWRAAFKACGLVE
jgi:hypoxanthine-DNA glycosylase